MTIGSLVSDFKLMVKDLSDVLTLATTYSITKTRPCNIQRFFSPVKIENFIRKKLIFFLFLLKTCIVGTR